MARARIRTVMINAVDVDPIVAFWSSLLDVKVRETDDNYVWLEPDAADGVNVAVQRVAALETPNSGVHVDVAVDDLDEAERWVTEAGGTIVERHRLDSGFEWRVAADPDGNQFCLFVEP